MSSALTRLVVRTTNTRIIVQIVKTLEKQDRTVCSADSRELARYGVPAGFSNAPAGFLTGLLIAKRFAIMGIDGNNCEIDVGDKKPDGMVVTAVIRGATVGGLLPGDSELTESELSIYMGSAIAAYMHRLSGDEERYRRQFGRFQALGIGPEQLGPMYEHARAEICERPQPQQKKTKEEYKAMARAFRSSQGERALPGCS